jgi:hypothetical protein
MSIEEITKLFALVEDENAPSFKGYLAPSQSYVWAYNQAALTVYGKIIPYGVELYAFSGAISSIDDSCMPFFGPTESKEKASKRLLAFKSLIQDWHPRMPDLTTIDSWCQSNGVTYQLG